MTEASFVPVIAILNAFDLVTGDRPASSVYADRNGRVWIGFVNGTVGMYDERNALVLYSESSGLPGGGTITAIYQDRQGTHLDRNPHRSQPIR